MNELKSRFTATGEPTWRLNRSDDGYVVRHKRLSTQECSQRLEKTGKKVKICP